MGYFTNACFVAGAAFAGLKIKNLIMDKMKEKLQKPLFSKEKRSTHGTHCGN